jgi:ATP-binding protein involved in chromosome partitioning
MAVVPDDSELRAAVSAVIDPDLGRALGELGMVRQVRTRRGTTEVVVVVPVAGWPVAGELEAGVTAALGPLVGGEAGVAVRIEVMADDERAALLLALAAPAGGELPPLVGAPRSGRTGPGGTAVPPGSPGSRRPSSPPGPLGHEEGRPNRFMLPGSRTRVVGVSSGKGGVGKSSVTVNLAVALAARGHEVGLLDADVYGFSVPKMLGVDRDPTAIGELLVPPVVHGVRCLSMGYFVPDDQPVIWRGPMLHKALEQFLVDAYWGEPDFLLVDMPPGTGDVALSMGQYLPRTEIVVVTTPQPAAQRVAQRSAYAARRLKLPVRGVIENMSFFTGDDGRRYELFGSGGGEALAQALEVPLLGCLPFVPEIRVGADVGAPVRVSDPTGEAAAAFDALADALVSLGPARVYRRELTVR